MCLMTAAAAAAMAAVAGNDGEGKKRGGGEKPGKGEGALKKKELGCKLACATLFLLPSLCARTTLHPMGQNRMQHPTTLVGGRAGHGPSSNLLNLVPNYHGIVLSDLLGTHFLIVKRAVVLIGVSMQAAEEAPTATLEAGEAHFFAAYPTPVLLLLLVLLVVLLAACFRGHTLCRF